MIQRCTYEKSQKWHRYGGRGITVCERWLSFENFLADMGERPEGMTLDRYPNRDGNYEPGNCRWATAQEQADNRDRSSFDSRSHRTHCRSGHEYTEANTHRTTAGARKCRMCDRIRAAKAREKKREANNQRKPS